MDKPYSCRGLVYKRTDGTFTMYDLDIAQREGERLYLFVIRQSPFNEGKPINDTLIVNKARQLAEYYDLKPTQVNLYAETPDKGFVHCNFQGYAGDTIMDFEAGCAKIPVSKEYVEKQIEWILHGRQKQQEQTSTQEKEQTPAQQHRQELENATMPSLEKILKQER